MFPNSLHIIIVFHRVMTFAYDISFVVDMDKPTLSILPRVSLAFPEFLLISFVDYEVYLILILIPVAFPYELNLTL